MDLSHIKEYAASNPLQAAVVAVVAVLASPVILLAATPVLQFLLVHLAPILVPALVLAVVSYAVTVWMP